MAFLSSDFQFFANLALNPVDGILPVVRGKDSAPTSSFAAIATDDYESGNNDNREEDFFRVPIADGGSGPAVVTLTSTDSTDDVADDGAKTVRVIGLDGSYNVIEEIVDMDGTSGANTSSTFLRVHEIRVETHGNTGDNTATNAGDITATFDGASAPCATILAGENTSGVGHFTIPDGMIGYLQGFDCSFLQGSATANPITAVIQIMVRPWILRDENGDVLASASQYYGPWHVLREAVIEPGDSVRPLMRPEILTRRTAIAIRGKLKDTNNNSQLTANLGLTVQAITYPTA